MAENIVNGQDLDDYLKDVIYRGQQKEIFTDGNFNSIDFVEHHKDAIIRSMLLQWTDYTLKPYMSTKTPQTMRFLPLINVTDRDLPEWAKKCMQEGKPVYRFQADKISETMEEKITMVRDYLYSVGEGYVNKVLARAKDTQKKYAQNPQAKGNKNQEKPRIRIDFLKTSEEYADFNQVLTAAEKWHQAIAGNKKFKKFDEQLYKESLTGTQPIMELGNGMQIVQLLTPQALDFESDYMGHCVGKGYYDDDIKSGKIKIYSLRDEYGEPHATFEVYKDKIQQCKGKNDKAPVAKYRPYIQAFVRAQNFDIEGDSKNICLIKYNGEYYDIFNLPKGKKLVLNNDLDLSDMGLTALPDLSNLVVRGYFSCRKNKLSSLKGAPKQVLLDFYCDNNQLTSLEYLSKGISSLYCYKNQLTSLQHAPEVLDDLYCSHNQLSDLRGSPKRVKGIFKIDFNPLVSLAGFPDIVEKEFHAINNDLESVEDVSQQIKGSAFIHNSKKSFFMVQHHGKLLDLTQQPDGFIYDGYIDISGCKLSKLPDFSRIIVKDSFYCEENMLTSFIGSPKEVGDVYAGNDNPVTSLEGLPKKIGCQLSIINCSELVTLKGISQEIGECLNLYDCPKLDSLDYLPQKGCKFICIDERFLKKYHIKDGATLKDVKKMVAQYNAAFITATKDRN